SNINKINILAQARKIDAADASRILEALRGLDAVLGFLQFHTKEVDCEIRQLLKARERARTAHNWMLADKLRDQLKTMGIVVRDGKL
ncbi:MAG: cysteine--tRNA ligase, partial [Desulfobacterales bacterium]